MLDLTTAEVAGVATFYTQYKRHPNGDYTVGVCTNTLCAVMGGDQIFGARSATTSASATTRRPTTARITLERIECNAACDYAPVVMVNWEFFDNQTPAVAPPLVDDLRAGEPRRAHPRRRTVCTFKQVSRVLAGFADGRADEGVGAGPASAARACGWPASSGWAAPDADGRRAATAPTAAPPTTPPRADAAERAEPPRRRRRASARAPVLHGQPRERPRRDAAGGGGQGMSTTLTPVLTRFWDDPRSWTLETYEQHDGYQGAAQRARRCRRPTWSSSSRTPACAAAAAPASRPA